MDKYKQVIIVRRDLKMPCGKLAAQVSHASIMPFKNTILGIYKNLEEPHFDGEIEWISGSMTKIVLGVDDESELLSLAEQVKIAKLPMGLVKDEGRTLFKEPTYTCLGIGPAVAEKINVITGHLKLY